jgi:hypothetical protein
MGIPRQLRKAGVIGMMYAQIEAAAGPPTTGHVVPDGGRSLQWLENYQFAIDTDVSERVVALREKTLLESTFSWRLRALGDIRGVPLDDMVWHLGPPNSRSAGAGYTLLQWMREGYHLAMSFDAEGKCEGITHEFSA